MLEKLTIVCGDNASGKTTFLKHLLKKLNLLGIKSRYFSLFDFHIFKQTIDEKKSYNESFNLFLSYMSNEIKSNSYEYVLIDDIFNYTILFDSNIAYHLGNDNSKVIISINKSYQVDISGKYLVCSGGRFGHITDGDDVFEYNQYIDHLLRDYRVNLLLTEK